MTLRLMLTLAALLLLNSPSFGHEPERLLAKEELYRPTHD